MTKFKKKFFIIYFSGLLLIPIVLIILPADFFDKGQSFCLSVLLFDQTCPGCGITRAIQHLIHLDFTTTYSFNKLAFIVFPVLTFVYIGELRRIYKKIKTSP